MECALRKSRLRVEKSSGRNLAREKLSRGEAMGGVEGRHPVSHDRDADSSVVAASG